MDPYIFAGIFPFPQTTRPVHVFLEEDEIVLIARQLGPLIGQAKLSSLVTPRNGFQHGLHTLMLKGLELRNFRQWLQTIEPYPLEVFPKTPRLLLVREAGLSLLLAMLKGDQGKTLGQWLIGEVFPQVKYPFRYRQIIAGIKQVQNVQLDLQLVFFYFQGRPALIAHQLDKVLGGREVLQQLQQDEGFVPGVHWFLARGDQLGALAPFLPEIDNLYSPDLGIVFEPGLQRLLRLSKLPQAALLKTWWEQEIRPLPRLIEEGHDGEEKKQLPVLIRTDLQRLRQNLQSDFHSAFESFPQVIAETITQSVQKETQEIRLGQQQTAATTLETRESVIKLTEKTREIQSGVSTLTHKVDYLYHHVSSLPKHLEEVVDRLFLKKEEAQQERVKQRSQTNELAKLARQLGLYQLDHRTPHVPFVTALVSTMDGSQDIWKLAILLEGRFGVISGENCVHLDGREFRIWKS